MKKITVLTLIVTAAAMMGCSGTPKSRPVEAPSYVEKTSSYVVIDHAAKAIGQDVPNWVTIYIADGLPGVEALPEHRDKYVFIGLDTGTNLNALTQWSRNYTVNQEIAQMVNTRVQAKFAGAAAGSPDAAFGRYFENVIKSVSAASFSGARKEKDFWLLKRYFKADGKTIDREVYDYYVLVSIDKDLLERQVDTVLDRAERETTLTSEQETAVERVREAFYEGF